MSQKKLEQFFSSSTKKADCNKIGMKRRAGTPLAPVAKNRAIVGPGSLPSKVSILFEKPSNGDSIPQSISIPNKVDNIIIINLF